MNPVRYCAGCGKPLDAGARFCGACGISTENPGSHEPAEPVRPETGASDSPSRSARWRLPALMVAGGIALAVLAIVLTGGDQTAPPAAVEVGNSPTANPTAAIPVGNTDATADATAPEARPAAANSISDVVDLPVTGWTYNPPSADYADLPALVAEVDYSPDNGLGQLVFVCQTSDPSPAYFALLVAPSFDASAASNATLAIEGAGAQGTLNLALRDLYGTQEGERPNIDWDATILFAPIEMEDLGVLIQANALLMKAADKTWRLAGGASLDKAGGEFLGACE